MPRKLAKPEDQMKRQLIANIQYEAEIRSIDREGQALVAHCSEGTYRNFYGGRVVKACQQIWHTYSEPFQG